MNELQQKLARRRNLNGEGGAAGVPVEPDHHSSSPPGPHHLNRKSSRSNSINPPSSGTTVDELQKKLARRRSLNGESVPADGDSGTNSRQTSHEHMHDVASFAALAQEALLHSLEPTRSSDPHDLNEADLHQEKSTPSSIAHHNHIDDATSKEEHTEEVSNNIDAVPEPTSDAGMIPGESPALEYLHQDSPDDHDVNAQSTPMSTACDLVQPVDDVISSEELEIVPIEPSNPVTEAPDHSDDAPLESPQHHEDVPCADCQVAADNDPPAVEMSKVVEAVGHDHEASSDLFDSVQQPTRQLMEDDAPTHQELCCAPTIEEGALATGSEQSSEAIAAPSPAPDPVLPSSPPSSVDPVPPTSVRTPTSPQNTQPCEPTPLLGSCADEVSPPSASNPPAALSSPSTLRKVTVVNAIIHPLDPVEVGSEQEREIEEDHKEVIHPENIVKPVEAPARLSEEAPPRGSEAAAAAHSSASGANSPPPPPLSRTASSSPKVVPALNRSNSSTGTSASAPAPSSPSPSSSTAAGDRWYPGKYFYERRLPWSSKSKLHMDSDAARSHYQDFMSTSRSSSSASTSSPMMAPAAQVGHNPILQTPVPKTLREFEAENQFLRQEVERLRREVDQKQAIIDAYELSYKASVFSNTDVDIEAVRESPIVSSSPTPPAAKAVVAMEPMEDSTSNTSSGRMDPTTEGTQKVKKNRKKPTPARLLRMHSRLRTEPTDGAEDDDGEGEDDEDGGGLFGDDDEEEDGDEERKKRSGFVRGEEDFKKEGGFGGFGAGGRRIPVDLDFLNSVTSTTRLSPSASMDNNWVDQDKALMGGDGKRRYDPRSIASEGDLVRSFAANVRGLRGEEDSITNPSLRSAINDLAQDLGTTEKSRLFQSNEGGVQSAATPSSASNSGSDSAATRSAAAANSNGPAPTQEMSYEEFMSKFSKCTELVQATRLVSCRF